LLLAQDCFCGFTLKGADLIPKLRVSWYSLVELSKGSIKTLNLDHYSPGAFGSLNPISLSLIIDTISCMHG
jgi:hypothetical protein